MLARVLSAAGYRCGMYTSPHLVTLRERVRVDGRPIPERSVTAFVNRHRSEMARRKLSFFEVMTAMAFEHFSRRQVDIAVIEVGLGGRLDATNVLTPELTMTTDISYDHVEILGPTLKHIAREKAGIIKPGVPHLMAPLPSEAASVVRDTVRQRKASLVAVTPKQLSVDLVANRVGWSPNGVRPQTYRSSLLGKHQLRNAGLAIAALETLRSRGWKIPMASIREGLASIDWPGRFQIIDRPEGPIVLDVGHNPGGSAAFAETWRRRFGLTPTGLLILGLVKRKDHQRIITSLAPCFREVILAPAATRRSLSPEELQGYGEWEETPVSTAGSLRTAWRRASRRRISGEPIAVVGSHYLVGEWLSHHRRW